MPSRVLVTGVSGYVALHVVDQLLKDGHKVRGTIRSLKDEKKVQPIRKLALDPTQLELVEADLDNESSWPAAVKDIDIVIHVASPFPLANPQDEQSVIKPAVDGTLFVLRACAVPGSTVKRVVVTSSGYSVFGENLEEKTYTEKDWADVNSQKSAYAKSKILAERSAWDFVEEKKKKDEPVFELSVINPVLVLGPILTEAYGSSAQLFLNVFQNPNEKVTNYPVFCCDVRDVALAHVRAAFLPEAAGKRFLITAQNLAPPSIWAQILSTEFRSKGLKIPTEVEGGFDLNTKIDNTSMQTVLGITPRDFKETLVDMANSFIKFGIAKLP